MELSSIHHLAIQVQNVDRAVQWYRSNFKCEIAYQDATWALLKFKNLNLALVMSHEHPAHLAFSHDNIAKFGEPGTHRDGTRYVYLHDPEGNTIEVIEAVSK